MTARALKKTIPQIEVSKQDVVDRVQRVPMDQKELSLYIVDGRPTGLLFKSIADLKGLSTKETATKSGVPQSVVEVVMQDGATSSVKTAAVLSISKALGIDLVGMCLAPGVVHTIDLRLIPLRAGKQGLWRALRAVGLLMRGAVITKLDAIGDSSVEVSTWFADYHLAQAGGSRAIFVTSKAPFIGRPFDGSAILSSRWLRGDSAHRVEVSSFELCTQLRSKDLNRLEFDQIFKGADSTSWEDIRDVSRAHNISRSEILDLIKTSAGVEPERSVATTPASAAPSLRLVHVVERAPS